MMLREHNNVQLYLHVAQVEEKEVPSNNVCFNKTKLVNFHCVPVTDKHYLKWLKLSIDILILELIL